MLPREFTSILIFTLMLLLLPSVHAEDVGKEKIGRIRATLYIGTNTGIEKLGDKTLNSAAVPEPRVKQLQSLANTRFNHYRQLGVDTQSIFRSYENWLSPLKPSEEILLSFDSKGSAPRGGLRIDLEFWQHRQKVMKSDLTLYLNHPYFILGPKWRGGTLIIAVELVEIAKP